MAEKAYVPELIISSPARRAAETASLLKEAAGFDAELRFDERIYEASSAALLDVVNNVEETFATLMLVGHNPGTEDFIHYLTGSVEVMPTAALAVIDLDISSWRDAKLHSGRLVQVIRPKKARKG
jgi:phosphohistidine phosphatase